MSGFEAPFPLLPAVVVAIGGWLAAAGWEWRRGARGAGIRLALLAVAIAALLGLYLRPVKAERRSPAAYLLTEGWREALRAADGDLEPDLPIWAAPGLTAVDEVGEAGGLRPRVAPLSRLAAVAGSLRIVGHGLAREELEMVRLPVRFTAVAPAPAGVAAVGWRRRLERGEALVVRGRLTGVPPETRVALVGPGGAEDEARVDSEGAFLVRATPRAVGRLLWKLRVEAPGLGEREEILDVEVVAPAPFALLWLEDTPSFESGPVQRWLRDLGRGVAVRTRVSRGRFRTELDNLPPLDLARLSSELLGRFDLLIADAGTAARWAGGERTAVRTAVEEGLGLLLLAGSRDELAAAERLAGVVVVEESSAEPWLLRLRLPDLTETPALELAPRRLRIEAGARPLVQDRAGRVLVATRPLGAGAVGFSLVADSFRWALRGERQAHRAFWVGLIGELGRARRGGGTWRIAGGPISIDRRLAVTLAAAGADPPRASWTGPSGEVYRLALAQGPWAPRLWSGALVPREEGWHRLEGGGATAWFYAQPPDAWAARDTVARQAATHRAQLLGPASPAGEQAPLPTAAGTARILLLLVALAALGGLWWDPWLAAGRGSSETPAGPDSEVTRSAA